ncbi:hypothetical protein CXG81DRAFT_10871 [Caulochytrium protostelioides]|uniref:Ubiquitin-like protease family profile domain-containing protein n=1 Tax=Caulochytrium protostelioides TaxID=1555241 RepID=A0A4P9XAI9_9FUNG|nr:hypothetical protein CXG81DRAFT_10871 [Caulochytrium protostelioides]|eukprot:RKP02352.1 hypothetical protein CXG81DRAFT_10871 [Caulochytrium protostelioides]
MLARLSTTAPQIDLEAAVAAATPKPLAPTLTDAQRAAAQRWYAAPRSALIVAKFNVDLRGADIATLRPRAWVNDEIINFYGQLIMDRAKQHPDAYPSCLFFNTFFYPTLIERGYAGVRRWGKRAGGVFQRDLVLVPVHLGVHWTAAVVDFRRQEVAYYDSMLGDNPALFDALRTYLDAEHRSDKGTPMDWTGWRFVAPRPIPVQHNGYDCGVYATQFLEYRARDAPRFDFSDETIPAVRERMVYEIATGELLAA